MPLRGGIALLVALHLAGGTAVAARTDIGVVPKKLSIVDKSGFGGGTKMVFVATDREAGITKGSSTFVTEISARIDVAYASGATAGSLVVPAGRADGGYGWVLNSATSARYVNKFAPAGPTNVRVATIKPGKLLKVVSKGPGDTPIDIVGAGDPGAGTLYVSYCVVNYGEEFCHCSAFSDCAYRLIGGGLGAKLSCRLGAADPACHAAPTTTSTTTSSTSTSSSTTTSSTTSTTTSTSTSTTIVLPGKIAAIGDSITQAFDADCTCNTNPFCLICLAGGDQPEHSWFDGTSGSVFSVHDRYLQLDAAITADKSAAADGSEMRGGSNDFSAQADAVLAQVPLPDHVEIELGGNDICNRDCTNPANCGDPLYSDAEWRAALQAGLDKLVAGLPLGATVYVAGVPRVQDLRQAGLDRQAVDSNVDCTGVWSTFGVCEIATSGSSLNGESIATRLAAIAARQRRYNEIILEEATAYDTNANGRNPRGIEVVTDYVDEATPSVGTFTFGAFDIDGGDCFHPSIAGQNAAASLVWAGNPDR